MAIALEKLSVDDPTFLVKQDENTGQTLISGMGELHLQVLEERLVREFNLKVRIGKPQVTYRETIRQVVEAHGSYDRLTAGKQNFAEVKLRVSPLGRSEGFRFVSALPEGRIPASMIGMVEAACRDATESGILYGYPVVDLQVELIDGVYNEMTSTELAFRIAATNAFREGCKKAGPILLEPVMSLEIVAPRDFVGGVMSNLASRRGRVIGTEMRDQVQILKAEAPLSQMFGYATDLRSASQGRATYSMIFSHFEEVSDPGAFQA
jgi:elongation factor G